MSFFARLFSQFFQEQAVTRLASSKTFQNFAVRTVDAQRALEKAAEAAAKDPTAAMAQVGHGTRTFWSHLKKEIAKDLGGAAAPARPAELTKMK